MKIKEFEKTISLRIDEKLDCDLRRAIGSESLSGWLRKLITRELGTMDGARAEANPRLVLA